MDLFNVVITERASLQLQSYSDYIMYTLFNESAAKNLIKDARETIKKLEYVAASLPICQHPVLKDHNYRIIHFRRYKYIMAYRIKDNTVYVNAIYHEEQNYTKILVEEIEKP